MIKKAIIVYLFFALLASSQVASADPLEENIRHLFSIGNNLYTITLSGIYRSSNGEKWQRVYEGEFSGGEMINFKNKIFAVGASGILASADGETWEKIYESEFSFFALESYNGFLYAGGWDGILRSEDGSKWEKMELPPDENANSIMDIITYKNNLYAGKNNFLLKLTDGEAWKKINISGVKKNIGFAPNMFMSFNNQLLFSNTNDWGIYRSSDAINWEGPVQPRGAAESFAVFKDKLYSADGTWIQRSSDGINFERIGKKAQSGYGATTLAAFNDKLYWGGSDALYRSSDGETWKRVALDIFGGVKENDAILTAAEAEAERRAQNDDGVDHFNDIDIVELIKPGKYTKQFDKKPTAGGGANEDVDIFKIEAPDNSTIRFKVTPKAARPEAKLGVRNSKLMDPPTFSIIHSMFMRGGKKASPLVTRVRELRVKVNSKNTVIKKSKGVFYIVISGHGPYPYKIDYRINLVEMAGIEPASKDKR